MIACAATSWTVDCDPVLERDALLLPALYTAVIPDNVNNTKAITRNGKLALILSRTTRSFTGYLKRLGSKKLTGLFVNNDTNTAHAVTRTISDHYFEFVGARHEI